MRTVSIGPWIFAPALLAGATSGVARSDRDQVYGSFHDVTIAPRPASN